MENKGDLHFEGRSFLDATKGRWMVLDPGEMDEDGNLDIVLGSFSYFMAQGDTTGLGKKWLESGPSVILLENTIK